jgi:hypothetical protein
VKRRTGRSVPDCARAPVATVPDPTALSIDDWISWFESQLAGVPALPFVSPAPSEIHQLLIRTYRTLADPPTRQRWTEAFVRVVQGTETTNAEARWYTLLQVTAAVRPPRVYSALRRVFLHGSLSEQTYAQQDLPTLLVTVLSKYEIDDEVESYIVARLATSLALRDRLIAIRLLAGKSPRQALSLVDGAIALATGRVSDSQIGRIVIAMAVHYGFSPLWHWHNREPPQHGPSLAARRRSILLAALEEVDAARQDPYAALLRAELAANTRQLRAKELLDVAALWKKVGRRPVARTLTAVYKRALDPSKPAWTLITPSRYPSAFRTTQPASALCVGATCLPVNDTDHARLLEQAAILSRTGTVPHGGEKPADENAIRDQYHDTRPTRRGSSVSKE